MLASILLVAVVAAVVGGIALSQMAKLNDRLFEVDRVTVRNLGYVAEIRHAMMKIYDGSIVVAQASGGPIPPGMESVYNSGKKEIEDGDAMLKRTLTAYQEAAVGSAQREQLLAGLADDYRVYKAFTSFIFFGTPMPAGMEMPTNVYALNAEISNAIDELNAIEQSTAADFAESSAAAPRSPAARCRSRSRPTRPSPSSARQAWRWAVWSS